MRRFFKVNITPLQLEHLATSHPSIQGATNDRLEACARTRALCDQLVFLLSGQQAFVLFSAGG